MWQATHQSGPKTVPARLHARVARSNPTRGNFSLKKNNISKWGIIKHDQFQKVKMALKIPDIVTTCVLAQLVFESITLSQVGHSEHVPTAQKASQLNEKQL